MGIVNRLKDAENMVEAAPEMLRHTQTVGAQTKVIVASRVGPAGGA